MLDFRLGSNWLIFCLLLNFEGCKIGINYLRHFFINFKRKFPKISKASMTFYILIILKEVMSKRQKIKKSENMPI